jgi:hypothetical protein
LDQVQEILNTGKPLFKIFGGSSEFEHYTEDDLKCRKFNGEINDLGQLKLNSE